MKLKSQFLIFYITLVFITGTTFAQKQNDSIKEVKMGVLIKDDPIVSALDSLHALTLKLRFEEIANKKSIEKSNYSNFDPLSDTVLFMRMEDLNNKTPINLSYNSEVKKYIDLYINKRGNLLSKMLGMGELYFPIFEEYLDKYNLPFELKYLAIVESALKPTARSRVGATGLWQFMLFTGKAYDLYVNSFLDDRCDPIKATEAACQHFCDLYDRYKDWNLVLAAYNSGAGNVNKAIRRSGGEMDFWKIMDFLPRETQGYVPAFIAVTYAMTYHKEHNIYPQKPEISYFETDTVVVKKNLAFSQISEFLKVPYEEIEFLNPRYRMGFIPASEDDEKYILTLPLNYIGDFLVNEQSIYNYKTKEMEEREKMLADAKNKYGDYKKAGYSYYVVQSGDVLGKIAQIYNCSTNDIKLWNNLYNNTIYPGQKLYVRGTPNKAEKKKIASSVKKTSKPVNYNKFVYYTVKEGDTLWDISQKHAGSTVDEIKRINNLGSNNLQPGQKLKIGITG